MNTFFDENARCSIRLAPSTGKSRYDKNLLLHGRSEIYGLPALSSSVLAVVSTELNDHAVKSSTTRAGKLYASLLQAQQQYCTDFAQIEADIVFARLIRIVRMRLKNVVIKSRHADGTPNGMPLFFHVLEDELFACVHAMKYEARERRLQATLKRLQQGAVPLLTAEEMVREMLRLHGKINDEELRQLLRGNAPGGLMDAVLEAIRVLWIQEILDKLAK
ncbi:MAG TPA: hypothetical protein VL461_06400 [Dictyobacter sp.]|nr:hypothetical protein [Dictyobacter sp.]